MRLRESSIAFFPAYASYDKVGICAGLRCNPEEVVTFVTGAAVVILWTIGSENARIAFTSLPGRILFQIGKATIEFDASCKTFEPPVVVP